MYFRTGFSEELRRKSLEKTSRALISRSVAGIGERPSSSISAVAPACGREHYIDAVWQAIPHAVEKIQENPSECAT